MIVQEIVDGQATLTEREALSYADIRSFVGGDVEGASLSSDSRAQSVIAYFHADGANRHELPENCHLPNGRTLYGPVLMVGLTLGGAARVLLPEEVERLVLTGIPRSPLPMLMYAVNCT